MKFSELVDQAGEFLRQRERVSYRALKREFDLDDETLEDLKAELIDARRVARDEDGKVLVWTGNASVISSQLSVVSPQPLAPNTQSPAERRQLTVLFCDLVGSTALSTQLDPEDYRAVVQRYQQTCTEVIQRHEGYLAQYLGDGLLVYFGYPTAHEDDARRAVRTGLEIITALQKQVPSPLRGEGQGEGEKLAQWQNTPHPNLLPQGEKELRRLQVRIGIHTGLVVVGEIGSSEKRELLALGETPNVAARIQGLAEPNTVIISAATQRLIEGQFECQPFGSHLVKGIATPISVYHVESERQGVSPLAGRATLTPLVGREQEVGLLLDRWEQVKEGRGQVVLLSGEPGIGKSRLAYTLREHITSEGSLLYEARCSPYHQHSALYPLIDVLQRTLLLTSQDTNDEKVAKLERALALYNMQETLPLFTALLSLPTPTQYPPLNLTPQKQKEHTLQALVQLLMAQAERQATVSVWEDLHWADPSSLEFLTLLIEQIPTTKLLLVLTFRPEFSSPWKPHSHVSQLVLNRLGKRQVQEMVKQVVAQAFRPLRLGSGQASTGSGRTDLEAAEQGDPVRAELVEVRTAIPDSLLNAVIDRTDGVPLFVEELTKAVLETDDVGTRRAVSLQTIPATLQEALLARLDRLSTARQTAQLGATLGREFSYELLHAVAPTNETDLQAALIKLVEAEILYQRGVGQQTRYFFKHALIQDAAYQSLLKRTRQHYHQQIAHVLEERLPETKETQPELLAHHYTEAGLLEQAIPYWQKAGERASQRSAHVEAISHLNRGLEVLKTLPDTPERIQQELTLQITLNDALITVKGETSPDVEKTVLRARELCQQLGEVPQLFPVLWRLVIFYINQGELQTTYKLAEQMMHLAQSVQDPEFLWIAHFALGAPSLWLGELVSARRHLEQAIALSDDPQTRLRLTIGTADSRVNCLFYTAWTLWHLGYPDQALKRCQEAIALAEGLSHPYSLAVALGFAALFHLFRGDAQLARERAERVITLSTEQGFSLYLMYGMMVRGWVLTEQGQVEEGIAQMRQSPISSVLAPDVLAEAYGKAGQVAEGLTVLAEALDRVDKTGGRCHEAELYRVKGELLLAQEIKNQKSKGKSQKSENPNPKSQSLESSAEAEVCFHKAIEIARRQSAKSLELRTTTSLARLWQGQGKKAEAHKLLSNVYNWFTEGLDTKDLREAKELLDELA